MADRIAIYNDEGCVGPLENPGGPGYSIQFNGSGIVWVSCDCGGGGGGGGGDADCCIVSAAFDEDGILVLTKADSSTITAGPVSLAGFVPFRIAGALGSGGSSVQPSSTNNVSTVANIQHFGNVLLGGTVNNAAEEKLHVKGNTLLQGTDPEIELRRDGALTGTEVSVFVVHRKPANASHNLVEFVSSTAANAQGDVIFQVDNTGNVSNTRALHRGAHGSQQAWHSMDDRDAPGDRSTLAPRFPLSPYSTARYTLHVESDLF